MSKTKQLEKIWAAVEKAVLQSKKLGLDPDLLCQYQILIEEEIQHEELKNEQ